jgi:hypothetical protein
LGPDRIDPLHSLNHVSHSCGQIRSATQLS